MVHISCTADDSKVDFTRDRTEEKHLFRFVWNICSPGTDRKLKKVELMWMSGNNTTSLAEKNKDIVIVPAQLRMAQMSTKKLSEKRKEEKLSEMDNRMMSVHAKLPELSDSDWSTQSRKELQEALTDGKITENDYNREIANLDEPIYGSGKTTDTKCVAQIGNYGD